MTKHEYAIRATHLLSVALILSTGCFLLLALYYLLSEHRESLAISCLANSLVCTAAFLGVMMPLRAHRFFSKTWYGVPVALTLIWLAWAGVLATMVISHSSDGWDECAYLLSGFALRGYPTPYAAHRAPLTHLLCAAFADVPALINPVLGLILLALLTKWGVQRWGRLCASLPLLMLLTQNVFLCMFTDVLSELPASLCLIAAFLLLSNERFLFSGIAFGLAGLARWNVAVIPVALILPLALRFGRRPTTAYLAGGACVACLFFCLSFAFVDHPLQTIVQGNLAPAYAWAEGATERPTFLIRSDFYLPHLCFLTPLGFLAIFCGVVLPLGRGRTSPDDWCVRAAIPFAVCIYTGTMFFIGGLFPRFMAPMLPLALFVLSDFAILCSTSFQFARESKVIWIIVTATVTIAWGFWPASVLLSIQENLRHRNVFSTAFAAEASHSLSPTDILHAPATSELARANGYPTMLELRRQIVFPGAERTDTSEIVPRSDAAQSVKELMATLPPGSLLLIPAAPHTGLKRSAMVMGDSKWEIWRVPEKPRQDGNRQSAP